MTLPTLSLPFPVSEAIPVLLHPAVVHFVIVLPIVILVIELINLITKRKALTISVYVLFVMLVGVYLAVYSTGVIDGKNGGLLMSDEGLEHLKVHKNIGIYLIYLSVIPLLLKLLTLAVKKPWAKIVYLVSFVAIIGLTGYQAKEGGELVYEYGLNVQAKVDLDDTVEELQDSLDEQKESYEEKIAALQAQLNECNTTEVNATIPVVVVPKAVVKESNTTVAVKAETNTTDVKVVETNSSKK